MMAGTDFVPEVQDSASILQIGVLPDAPLTMPKQRLHSATPFGRNVWTAILRPFLARPGRSEG